MNEKNTTTNEKSMPQFKFSKEESDKIIKRSIENTKTLIEIKHMKE